jgi:hypothetical protein
MSPPHMMEFDQVGFTASPLRAAKRAASAVSLPHRTPDSRWNRCALRKLPDRRGHVRLRPQRRDQMFDIGLALVGGFIEHLSMTARGEMRCEQPNACEI